MDRVGPGVTDVEIGQTGGNAWLWSACGSCEHCRTGWETLCEEQIDGGYPVDGAIGQYMIVDARLAAAFPGGADPFEVAPCSAPA
ncbi:hypothetical protein GCM10027061_10440 [Nesterenkonia suensis]